MKQVAKELPVATQTAQEKKDTRGRVFLLSLTLCFIIGGYWLLRTLKVPVLDAFVGVKSQPMAKIWSLVVMVVALVIYNYLLDILPRHQLFYVIGIFYSVLLVGITIGLNHPVYGMEGTRPATMLGWISFFAIESYGSLAVTLFWSFMNSMYSLQGAKKTYGYIIAGSQFGSIIGPTLTANNKYLGGIPPVFGVGSLCPILSAVVIFVYMKKYGFSDIENKLNKQEDTTVPKKAKTGIFEGLRLFAKHPYVAGIFAISCLFEITLTILDFEMLVLGREVYTTKEDFAAFTGRYGMYVNIASLLIALGGTTYIFKTCRLRYILVSFPMMVLLTVVVVYISPTLNVALGGMIFVKALTYAINNPAKEMLYSVTTSDIKFKSKSWIDAFGGRLAKAAGAGVNNAFKSSIEMLFMYGSMVSIALSVLLVVVASFMGAKCEKYQAINYKVGSKPVDPKEVALNQA